MKDLLDRSRPQLDAKLLLNVMRHAFPIPGGKFIAQLPGILADRLFQFLQLS